jgi:hypothetical protein
MFNPVFANHVTQFYALGNTPAVDLTRGLPRDLDADILLLGCGDVRNILYTTYSQNEQSKYRIRTRSSSTWLTTTSISAARLHML